MARYELVEGSSNKFWDVRVDGASLVTTWGRIGSSGSSTTRRFPDPARARAAADALTAQKQRKGYRLVGAKEEAPRTTTAPPRKAGKKTAGPEVQCAGLYWCQARERDTWLKFDPDGTVRGMPTCDRQGSDQVMASLTVDFEPYAGWEGTWKRAGSRVQLVLDDERHVGTLDGEVLRVTTGIGRDPSWPKKEQVYRFVPRPATEAAGPPGWRSLARGEVSLKELKALLKGFPGGRPFLDGCRRLGKTDVSVVDGDLARPELTLPAFEGGRKVLGLIVTGDLTLDGGFTDSDYPATSLFVLGDMTCGHVVTSGRLGVGGTLRAERGVVGDYNDYSAEIGGDLVTRVLWEGDHRIMVGGEVEAELDLDELKPGDYPARLRAGLYEGRAGDLRLDRDEVLRRIVAGEPLRKGTARGGRKRPRR